MKALKVILPLLCAVFFASFSAPPKDLLKDVKFTESGRDTYAVKDGAPYDGTAWSKDEKTMSVECKEGLVVSMTIHHDNGKPAVVFRQEDITCYDENGEKMEEEKFRQKYPVLMDKSQTVFEEELRW